VSDVVHVYERSLGVTAGQGHDAVVAAAGDMTAAGRRDLAGEGFDPAEAVTEVELDTRDGTEHRTVRAAAAASALERLDGGTHVDVVRVRVRRHLASCQPPPREARSQGEPTRRTLLLPDGSTARVPVHDWAGLGPGRHVDGPALAAGGSMTCLVPPGWVLDVDNLGDAALRRARSGREEER
jgi:N-methylhydantoinase A/oxoprolinase/acetone carboxylase beta subunit